jgi:hypothetical protein
MSQHPLDLLPDEVRARSLAGLRTGRFVTALVSTTLLVVILATHSVLHLGRKRSECAVAEEQAELVLRTEQKAEELASRIDGYRNLIDLYERIALPLEVSRVISTIVNELPATMTLDRIDLDAAARRTGSVARSKGLEDGDAPPPRVLHGEVAGFAVTDQEIAELVARLGAIRPFRDVSLDFSRTREVRGRKAREFRLSLWIDLDVPYAVSDRTSAETPPREELTHADE